MVLNYVVDGVYVLAALAVVILFAKRGFFSSVFHFGRYIAAAIVTYAFAPMLSEFLYRKWIFRWIAVPVSERVENFLNNTVGSVDMEGLVDSLPRLVKRFADTEALKEKFGATVDGFSEAAWSFSETVSAPFATLLSNILSYVAVFFVSVLLLKFLFFLLNKFFDSVPILKGTNRVLGALLGVLAAFLLLAGVTWLVGALIALVGKSEWLSALSEGRMFGFFQSLNFFNLFH